MMRCVLAAAVRRLGSEGTAAALHPPSPVPPPHNRVAERQEWFLWSDSFRPILDWPFLALLMTS